MVDHLAPTQAVPATSDDFRAAAKAAGGALREKLRKDSYAAGKQIRTGFESYRYEPYDEILEEVKTRFREQVGNRSSIQRIDLAPYIFCQEFPNLLHGSDFEWRTIRLITQDVALDEARLFELPMSLWALPLLVGDHNTIGQPIRLCELSKMTEGDIYFGYEVIKP